MASNLERMVELLTEQSARMGKHEANLSNLGRNFDRHCADDDRRHSENVAELREIKEALQDLRDIARPLSAAVEAMKPIVDGYQVTRMKFLGGLVVVGFIVGTLGWLITSIVGEFVKVLFAKMGVK